MEKYTTEELSNIAHSLGVKLFESAMSHYQKDKRLPDAFYRNFFAQRQKHPVFENLIEKGFATKRQVFDDVYYHINNAGIDKFRSEFTEIVNYQPVEKRSLEYLKHRINFYSKWYHYNFGDDNASHVISAYLNYFLKGFYMSHTTTICVKRFEKELKAAHKKGII